MAPNVQTVSIHEFLPASFFDGVPDILRLLLFQWMGALLARAIVFGPPRIKEAMSQRYYRKQKRFLAQMGKENFVRVPYGDDPIYPSWGGMPHVYHTSRNEYWVLKHYGPILAHFRHWQGHEGLKILTEIRAEWWLALDAHAVHIMVLAQVPDFGMTLRAWIREVNPHPLIGPLVHGRYESYIHEP